MVAFQQIHHDGDVVAWVCNGRAVITGGLVGDAFDLVRAKCLYALEVQAGGQPGPYTDRAATAYTRSAVGRGHRRCGTPRRT
ncbi:MAG TPA: hypothetical protein VFX51_06380 [Solirubrobacteraceae bacterium]|nr:hypothetical protein [Solirubrobacteraceae bacterium]